MTDFPTSDLLKAGFLLSRGVRIKGTVPDGPNTSVVFNDDGRIQGHLLDLANNAVIGAADLINGIRAVRSLVSGAKRGRD